MSIKFTEYCEYFENIAINHKSFRHQDTQKHFFKMEMEDLLQASLNNDNYPALVLEGYDINYAENGADNYTKSRTPGLIILVKVSDFTDLEEIAQAYDTAEALMDDVINLILQHAQAMTHAVVQYIDFNSINSMQFTDGNGGFGYRITFTMVSAHDRSVNTDNWTSTDF